MLENPAPENQVDGHKKWKAKDAYATYQPEKSNVPSFKDRLAAKLKKLRESKSVAQTIDYGAAPDFDSPSQMVGDMTPTATELAARAAYEKGKELVGRAERATVDVGVAVVGTGVHTADVLTKPGREYVNKNIVNPAKQPLSTNAIDYGPGPSNTPEQMKGGTEKTEFDRRFNAAVAPVDQSKVDFGGDKNYRTQDPSLLAGDTKPTALEKAVAGYVEKNITDPAKQSLSTNAIDYGPGPETHTNTNKDRRTGEEYSRNEMVAERSYGLIQQRLDQFKAGLAEEIKASLAQDVAAEKQSILASVLDSFDVDDSGKIDAADLEAKLKQLLS